MDSKTDVNAVAGRIMEYSTLRESFDDLVTAMTGTRWEKVTAALQRDWLNMHYQNTVMEQHLRDLRAEREQLWLERDDLQRHIRDLVRERGILGDEVSELRKALKGGTS